MSNKIQIGPVLCKCKLPLRTGEAHPTFVDGDQRPTYTFSVKLRAYWCSACDAATIELVRTPGKNLGARLNV